MNSISITYPGSPPESIRKNRGSTHWTDRSDDVREMRFVCGVLIFKATDTKGLGLPKTDGANTPTWEKAVVTVTQYHHGTPLDYEGLCSGMGPAIDAFVDRGVIKDDGPKYLLDYRMRHVKVATKAERRVEVTMAEVQLEEGDTIRSTVWKKPRKRPPLVLAEDDWDKPAEEQSGRPAHMTDIPGGA